MTPESHDANYCHPHVHFVKSRKRAIARRDLQSSFERGNAVRFCIMFFPEILPVFHEVCPEDNFFSGHCWEIFSGASFCLGLVVFRSAFEGGNAVRFCIMLFRCDFPPFFCIKFAPKIFFRGQCWQKFWGCKLCFGFRGAEVFPLISKFTLKIFLADIVGRNFGCDFSGAPFLFWSCSLSPLGRVRFVFSSLPLSLSLSFLHASKALECAL